MLGRAVRGKRVSGGISDLGMDPKCLFIPALWLRCLQCSSGSCRKLQTKVSNWRKKQWQYIKWFYRKYMPYIHILSGLIAVYFRSKPLQVAEKSVLDYKSYNSSPLGRLSVVYGHYNLNTKEAGIELLILNVLQVCCKNTTARWQKNNFLFVSCIHQPLMNVCNGCNGSVHTIMLTKQYNDFNSNPAL